jgi:signal transduction histidine kinase
MIRRWPIRIRLTVAFTVMMGLALAAVGAVTVAHTRSSLDSAITESLTYRLADLRPAAVAVDPILPRSTQDTGEQILDQSGQLLAATPELAKTPMLSPSELAAARRGPLIVDHATAGDMLGPVRIAATTVPGGRIVLAATTLADRDAAVGDLTRELAVGLPLVLLAAALGAYLLAAAALRPVEHMRARAAGISNANPQAHLPVPPADDEISRLAATFNELLARLHEALDRERQFVADAGHELRTPLSLLTTELELALRRPRSNTELTAALRSALDDVERLSRLARAMLAATADQPRRPDAPRPTVELAAALDTVVARYGASDTGADVTLDRPPEGLRVGTDPDDLDRMMTNLLDNAAEHGRPPITIRAYPGDAATVTIEVRDHGDGIDPDFLPHAFDRFTRADTSRTTNGSGLGLAIVTTLADRNHATVTAANHPGGGAILTIKVPAG